MHSLTLTHPHTILQNMPHNECKMTAIALVCQIEQKKTKKHQNNEITSYMRLPARQNLILIHHHKKTQKKPNHKYKQIRWEQLEIVHFDVNCVLQAFAASHT